MTISRVFIGKKKRRLNATAVSAFARHRRIAPSHRAHPRPLTDSRANPAGALPSMKPLEAFLLLFYGYFDFSLFPLNRVCLFFNLVFSLSFSGSLFINAHFEVGSPLLELVNG